ncbi:MAG: AAA family ATPase [Chitinivibrionales bacterium]|nr:AAA family ATPase [Chitinivibrionales bacterium]
MDPGSRIHSITQGLNKEQLAAVTSEHEGPVLVLAGAGCGKTSVLTRRIAFCACTRCDRESILALTFTRKAAGEMAERVARLDGMTPAHKMPLITTFHGFGLRVLKDTVGGTRNFERLGYEKEPELLPERYRLEMLAQCCSKDERRALGVDLVKLDNHICTLSVFPQKLSKLSSQRMQVLESISNRLREQKRAENRWEFSDMITETLRIFEMNEEITGHYQQKFRAILVDEFQDTNPLQIHLLRKLLCKSNTLFAVGDDDQAIYGFRGADIGPIMNFETCFPGANIYKLQTNYRSIPKVLNAANRIFKEKPKQLRKVLRSGKYSAEESRQFPGPSKRMFKTQEDMVSWIHARACCIAAQYEIPVCKMALLFRTNQTLEWTKERYATPGIADEELPVFSTIHGAKGLEFPVVFLCDLEEGVFPNYRLRKSQKIRTWGDVFKRFVLQKKPPPPECDIDEETRLFYVGVTRAEKILYLLSCAQKYEHGRRKKYGASRFLRLV